MQLSTTSSAIGFRADIALKGVHTGQAKERALLAICAYHAVSKGGRQKKARYLLEVEARGELDLAEHIQTILRSTMR